MEAWHYKNLQSLQEKHWFYRHRRELIRDALLDRSVLPGGDLRILDYGAGTGANLPALRVFGAVTAFEPSVHAAELMKDETAGKDRFESDIGRLSKEVSSYDVILVSYVLYHEAVANPLDDLKMLRSLAKPGAVLIHMEPAFASLTRSMDRVVHGARRFTVRELESLHWASGWKPEDHHYILPTFFPAAWLMARMDKRDDKPTLDHRSGRISGLNDLLLLWMRTGDALLRKIRVPAGVGALVASRAQ